MESFTVASGHVVSEVIDGEAVILDLSCGRYYTTEGVGAQVWRAASGGMPRRDILASCRARFPDSPSVGDDVAALLRLLVECGLLVSHDQAVPSETFALEWPSRYRTPTLERHDDLADMMALDPVHDVDATGWPTARNGQVPPC